ncbi:hypothetical protein B7P43_G06254, partial [Cryptotermes secundus]
RWVKHFTDGNTSIEDEPRSGRPRTASIERNKERADEIIQDDRRVTVGTIARKLGIGRSAGQEIIESLGYKGGETRPGCYTTTHLLTRRSSSVSFWRSTRRLWKRCTDSGGEYFEADKSY